jgi:hypothetical protein
MSRKPMFRNSGLGFFAASAMLYPCVKSKLIDAAPVAEPLHARGKANRALRAWGSGGALVRRGADAARRILAIFCPGADMLSNIYRVFQKYVSKISAWN